MFEKLRMKRMIRRAIKGCDFERVRDLMAQGLPEMVIRKELAALLDDYMENPCFDTAFNLIDYDVQNGDGESVFLKLFVQGTEY